MKPSNPPSNKLASMPPSADHRVSLANHAASLLFAICLLPFGPLLWWGVWLLLLLLGPAFAKGALLLYTLWFCMIDRAPVTGANYSKAVRDWRIWLSLARYFPIQVVSENGELDPRGRYMIGYHPHGVVSLGAFVTCGTAVGRPAFGSSLKVHLCTVAVNFKMPFIRELIMRLGIIPASKEAIQSNLQEAGSAVVIVVGGAKEALSARHGDYQLTLATRKGFVREALLANASLVPVFAFGENDLFWTPSEDSWLSRTCNTMQRLGVRMYGYAVPLFTGVIPYTPLPGGIQPKSVPLTVVVGAPLPVANLKPEDVTAARVDEWHGRYVEALTLLFERHRAAHGDGGSRLCVR